MINILVVTHGEFGSYAVEAAEGIVGEQRHGVRSVAVFSRMGLEEARARVTSAVAELTAGDGLLILTDIPGGTPSNLCLPLAAGRDDIAVLSGLNLYMLVTAFSKRALPLGELTQAVLSAGARSLTDVGRMFQKARLKAAA